MLCAKYQSSGIAGSFLAHGWWFSLGTPASSTTKTGRHDIAEILLKVAINDQIKSYRYYSENKVINYHPHHL
jgi:hypothetical protein